MAIAWIVCTLTDSCEFSRSAAFLHLEPRNFVICQHHKTYIHHKIHHKIFFILVQSSWKRITLEPPTAWKEICLQIITRTSASISRTWILWVSEHRMIPVIANTSKYLVPMLPYILKLLSFFWLMCVNQCAMRAYRVSLEMYSRIRPLHFIPTGISCNAIIGDVLQFHIFF